MKVFVDLHHTDLYYSLYLLFEKRLGFELYRPIGMDWYYENYWKIAIPYNNSIDTARQYLDINVTPWLTEPNQSKTSYMKDNINYIYDSVHDYYQKAITLNIFKDMKFDIIISSISLHDEVYKDLRNKYHPNAKIISHMGNVGQTTTLENVMHSVTYNKHQNQHSILIHQEIDTKLYKFIPINPFTKNIYSVVNLSQYLDIYNIYKNILIDCNFKYYGIGSPDGPVAGALGVSQKIIESNIGWSLKALGGIGHSNMGWCYSGRPLVTNMSQHRIFGGLALKLFEPGINCIDLDSDTVENNVIKIMDLLIPENSIRYGESLRNRFLELINYDDEAIAFRKFIENLL